MRGYELKGRERSFRELLSQEIADAAATLGYANYRMVREYVLRMKDHELDPRCQHNNRKPSEYWAEELERIGYMFDASPLVVQKLRHHCYHITGVWPYNYRQGKTKFEREHGLKLAALASVGKRELFVPEARELGGFGFELEEGLVNADTLKFFEVLIALDRAGALDEFRSSDERRYVVEIGGGWGGLAYQFKTLFPQTTYILVDLPEVFLFSATYLLTVASPNEAVFVTDCGNDLEGSWTSADFVFVPHFGFQQLELPRIDIALNTVSFQEMTAGQVGAYVRHLHERGCPTIYSLNRERSPYNSEIESVSAIIRRYYWLREVDVLPVSYQRFVNEREMEKLLRETRRAKRVMRPGDSDYRHLIGRRRLRIDG